jgi:cold shock CspA family protein
MRGVVVRLFRDEGFGFIKSMEGREIYFHRNSLVENDFDRLEIGTGVRWDEEEGEEGPQATSVRIVDKPGSATIVAEEAAQPPLGWRP